MKHISPQAKPPAPPTPCGSPTIVGQALSPTNQTISHVLSESPWLFEPSKQRKPPVWCTLENSPTQPRASARVVQDGILRRIVNPPPAVRYDSARRLDVPPCPNPVFIPIRERQRAHAHSLSPCDELAIRQPPSNNKLLPFPARVFNGAVATVIPEPALTHAR
jgi:hypothetical protein